MNYLSILFVIKGMVELCMAFLFGQAMMWVFLLFLNQEDKKSNFIYSLFDVINAPLKKAARLLAPRAILDSHLGIYAFGLLFTIFIFLIVLVIPEACQSYGLALKDCKIR